MTLRLRTFGAVQIERDGSPLGGAHSQRRRLALLAFLAASEKQAISRSRIIAMLWPESDEGSGRHSLSQLLYALRHDLGADTIAVDSDTVRLNHAALPSDVRAFDDALRAGRHEEAVEEYRGAFLDDFQVDGAPEMNRWIDDERDRRRHACARALDHLVKEAEKREDWHRAIDWLRRRIALDASDSRVTARFMRAAIAVGDREGALRVARTYEAVVRADGDPPDPEVVKLVDQLRPPRHEPDGRIASRSPTPTSNVAVDSPPPTPVSIAAVGSSPPDPVPRAAVDSPFHRPVDAKHSRTLTVRRARGWRFMIIPAAALLVFLLVRAARSTDDVRTDGIARVVIGDLEGPDSSLALAVREALRAELLNTRGVILTSDQGIRELKTLMRLDRDGELRPPQLLSLATRGGAHVAVSGSVIPVGNGAQIMLELLDPATGRSVQTFTERPTDGAETLRAVERLARSIGSAASRTPRDTTIRPLPAVTTASITALKSYALARRTAAQGRRREAVEPAERALAHDSTFVLAHYFLGDLLWFIDEQTHSEAHLTRAYQLRNTVPSREQLVIRARYEQLANDRPDSALAYWQLVADASPGDVMAYEGRTWALRALGRHEEAAAAADTAMTLDPAAILPNITNAVYSWLSVGDTASALEVARRVAPRYPAALAEARFYAALFRDPAAAMPWADSAGVPESRHWRRHLAQVAAGDVKGARATLDSVLKDDRVQMPPNALLHQGWLELVRGGGAPAARPYARATLAWTRRRDLSPPAIGRLAERIGDLAARAGDEATVLDAIRLVKDRDKGRSLRTYTMALATLDAALAYVRNDYARAARLAESARHGVYFSRSLTTIVQLEADARRAAGETVAADSLSRLVATHQIVDGHFEAWAILRAMTKLRN